MKTWLAFLVAIQTLFLTGGTFAQKKPPLRLLESIPIADLKDGDFDHFAVDLPGNRLFLTAEDNNVVEVFNIRTNKLIRTLRGVKAPHAIFYFPGAKQLWVVSGGDGTLKIFDGSTYALAENMKITPAADSADYDSAKHLLYVAAGGEDGLFVDQHHRHEQSCACGDIKVDSTNIEAMAIEKNGPRLFANVRDKNLVGVIDRGKRWYFLPGLLVAST